MTKKLYLNRNCGSEDLLEALLACKLISLEKRSGIEPVEKGEVIGKKIIVKFLTSIIVMRSW